MSLGCSVSLEGDLYLDHSRIFRLTLYTLPPLYRTHHHFYAEEATGKTQWLHPYDDPVFLSSLPDTHPANPNSESARAARSKADQLHAQAQAAMKQHQEETGERDTDLNGKNGKEKRKFFGRMEDKILGSTPEERKVKKAKKREEERVR